MSWLLSGLRANKGVFLPGTPRGQTLFPCRWRTVSLRLAHVRRYVSRFLRGSYAHVA